MSSIPISSAMATEAYAIFERAFDLMLTNASAQDRAHFDVLMHTEHFKALEHGKIIYLLPRTMGTKLGSEHMKELAHGLSSISCRPIFVHYDIEKSAYRIGPIIDNHDREVTAQCIQIHLAEYSPTSTSSLSHSPSATTARPARISSMARKSPFPTNANPTSSKQKVAKIPKPRNSWILYRQEKHSAVLADNPGMHTSKISTIISGLWRNESTEVKAHYKKLAEQEKVKHHLQHPTYKCAPRRSSEIKKRKRNAGDIFIERLSTPNNPRRASNTGDSHFSGSPMRVLPTELVAPSTISRQNSQNIDWNVFQAFETFQGVGYRGLELFPNGFLDYQAM